MEDNTSPTGKAVTLSDADISTRSVTRRSLLGMIGIGAGIATTAILAGVSPAYADMAGHGRACGFRDRDMTGGRTDTVRANCGMTDNDQRDRAGASSRCGFRDSDRNTGAKARDTIRARCGQSDSDRG